MKSETHFYEKKGALKTLRLLNQVYLKRINKM